VIPNIPERPSYNPSPQKALGKLVFFTPKTRLGGRFYRKKDIPLYHTPPPSFLPNAAPHNRMTKTGWDPLLLTHKTPRPYTPATEK